MSQVLHALLRERARTMPQSVGYEFFESPSESATLSYGALDTHARRIAAWLQDAHLSKASAVLAFPPGLEFIEAFWGCVYAGVVAIPVPPMQEHGSKLLAIVRDSRAGVVLTTSSVIKRVEETLSSIDGRTCALVNTRNITADHASQWTEPSITTDDIAYLQYTSGSTSAPRGVVVSHANVLANLAEIDEVFAHGLGDACVSWLPHFHDMGLVYGVLQPPFCGIPAHLLSPRAFIQNPLQWLQLIDAKGATHSGGPNFAYDLCVERIPPASCEGLDLSRWRVAFNGAEPVRRKTLERFAAAFQPFGFREDSFCPAYGLAEATLKVTCHARRPLVYQRMRSAHENPAVSTEESFVTGCGSPSGQTVVRIVDPERMIACAPDVIGEVWVAGPGVARGYWGRPEQTAAAFGARLGADGPFLRTGDLGFFHDGELFVTGRLKDVIIIRGVNYYPQDIEATAETAHSAVRPSRAAAFGIADGDTEHLVIAVEVVRHCEESEWRDAAAAIAAAVSRRHGIVPRSIAVVCEGRLPRTTSGKLQRYLCRAGFLDGNLATLGQVHFQDKRQPLHTMTSPSLLLQLNSAQAGERRAVIERYFLDLAIRVTKRSIKDCDPQVSLVSLGVDSLAAAEIAFEVERDLRVALEQVQVLTMTLRELSKYVLDLLDGTGEESAPTVPVESACPADEGRASAEQERLYWLQVKSPGSAAYNLGGAIRFSGPLSVEALGKVLDQLKRRHDILRTGFQARDGLVIRTVRSPSPAGVSLIDLSALSEPERQLDALLREQVLTSLDPRCGTCIDVRLYRLSTVEHVLMIVLHHIIADALSFRIAFDEIAMSYESIAAGHSAAIRDPPAFSRFVSRDSHDLSDPRTAECVAYWRKRLQLVPERRPSLCVPGASLAHSVTLLPRVTHQLREFSRSRGATVFMTIMAALAATLSRAVGEPTLTIGFPVSGRRAPGARDAIGPFSYPLPYVADVSGTPTFEELVASTRLAVLDAFRYQHVQFAHLVRAVKRRAWFRFMLTMLPTMSASRAIDKLTISPVPLELSALDLDLYVAVTDAEHCLRLTFAYNPNWRERPEVERLTQQCADLLDAGTRNPAIHLDGI
jgi:acyl-CoA synthetase (AMP-forming)/AMP-acid ligase II/acyl carrier protein